MFIRDNELNGQGIEEDVFLRRMFAKVGRIDSKIVKRTYRKLLEACEERIKKGVLLSILLDFSNKGAKAC